jgi:hypothetical protein
MTFSITTLSINGSFETFSITPSIKTPNVTKLYHYAECHVLFTVLANVIMLSVILPNVVVLSVVVPAIKSYQAYMSVTKGKKSFMILTLGLQLKNYPDEKNHFNVGVFSEGKILFIFILF